MMHAPMDARVVAAKTFCPLSRATFAATMGTLPTMVMSGGNTARNMVVIPLISGGIAKPSNAPPTGSGAPLTALIAAPATPARAAGTPTRAAIARVAGWGSKT